MILKEHKELLLSQSESKTVKEWCAFFEGAYTKNQIYCFCHRNGKKFRQRSKQELSEQQSKNSRKQHINQDYFKTWSSNMAYMFGFWCADGCIYGGKMFDITIHKRDKYILKKFAEELNYEGPLLDYVDRQAARLNFSCVVLYNDLIALGGSEAKSLTLKFPKVPKKYLSDFIRGYFDGDGSVYERQGKRLNSAFTCGSKEFINKLWEILKIEANLEGGSYDSSSQTLRFGNRDTLKLGEYMYRNKPDLFLLRKYEKFKKEEK